MKTHKQMKIETAARKKAQKDAYIIAKRKHELEVQLSRVSARLFEKTDHTRKIETITNSHETVVEFPHYPNDNHFETFTESTFVEVGGDAAELRAKWVSEEIRIHMATKGARTHALAIDAFSELLTTYFDHIVPPSYGNYEPHNRDAMQESILVASFEEVAEAFNRKLNERREEQLEALRANSTRSANKANKKA